MGVRCLGGFEGKWGIGMLEAGSWMLDVGGWSGI